MRGDSAAHPGYTPVMLALHSIRTLVVVFVFANIVSATLQLSPPVLHERRSFNPRARGWQFARRLEADVILPLRIGLTHRNTHTLEDELNAVAHPDSPNYGKHWTTQRVVEHFAPSRETINAVTDWLISSGVSRERLRLSNSRGWLEFNASVAEAESLLHTEYHVFEDTDGAERVGCDAYHVPEHLVAHIDLIKPTTAFHARIPAPEPSDLDKRAATTVNPPIKLGSPSSFNGPKTNGRKPTGTSSLGINDCDQFITPVCLQALYKTQNYKPVSTRKNTFGIVEFTPQAYLAGDLGKHPNTQSR